MSRYITDAEFHIAVLKAVAKEEFGTGMSVFRAMVLTYTAAWEAYQEASKEHPRRAHPAERVALQNARKELREFLVI